MEADKLVVKQASTAALMSLLNLTALPVIGFIILLFIRQKASLGTFSRYYADVGIKTNLLAGAALLLVTGLMILLGGFNSPWTWVYVISYFVIVHAMFILFATWVFVRAGTGEKLTKSFLTK